MPCITMSSFLVSRLSYRFPLGTILISAFLPLFILFPITLNTYNHHSAYLSPTSFRDNLRFYLFQDAFPNYSTIILAIPEISQGCIFLSHLNTSRIMQNYFMYPFPQQNHNIVVAKTIFYVISLLIIVISTGLRTENTQK